MPEPSQLTIHGGSEPLRRSCEDCRREIIGTVFATIGGGEDADARCADCDRDAAQRIFARHPLFTAPQTMRGQLAMRDAAGLDVLNAVLEDALGPR